MGETCQRHEGNAVIAKCSACGAGICRECRDEYGYFCSKECLERVRGQVKPEEKAKAKKRVETGMRLERVVSFCFKSIAFLILLILCYAVWALFFSPYGKLSWRYDAALSPSGVFPLGDGVPLLFLAGDGKASILNLEDGKAFSLSSDGALDSLHRVAGRLGDASLLQGDSSLALVSDARKILWRKDFPGWYVESAVCGLDKAFLLLRQIVKYKEDEKYVPPEAKLLALNGADGAELWTKKPAEKESFVSLSASEALFVCSGVTQEKDAFQTFLRVCDGSSGDAKWQVKFKGDGSLHPFFAGQALVFSDGASLNAVSLDGKRKLWSLKEGAYSRLSYERLISGDFLVMETSKGLVCASLKDGSILWEKSIPGSFSEAKADAGRLFLCVYDSAAAPPSDAAPKTMDDLKDSELSSAAVLDKSMKAVKRAKPSLLAIDLATGKELWSKERAVGRMVCGSGRLAFVVDSAKDLMISVIGGSLKGDMTFTQLDAASGKEILSASTPLGLCEPYGVCGDKFYGLIYDREASVSVLGMGKSARPGILGVAAFRLK